MNTNRVQNACNWLVGHLQDIGLQRRIWRPTVKFILGGGCLGSILTAVLFSLIMTIGCSKNPTLKSFLTTMILLGAMETVSDLADKYTTELLMSKNIKPFQTIRGLALATFLIYLEIALWTTANKFYSN